MRASGGDAYNVSGSRRIARAARPGRRCPGLLGSSPDEEHTRKSQPGPQMRDQQRIEGKSSMEVSTCSPTSTTRSMDIATAQSRHLIRPKTCPFTARRRP